MPIRDNQWYAFQSLACLTPGPTSLYASAGSASDVALPAIVAGQPYWVILDVDAWFAVRGGSPAVQFQDTYFPAKTGKLAVFTGEDVGSPLLATTGQPSPYALPNRTRFSARPVTAR